MGTRNAEAARISKAIREVFLCDWDPIGIGNDPDWPRDEYDSYIGEVYQCLVRGESAEFIARHLCLIEEARIGTGRIDQAKLLPVALKLKEIDVSLHKTDAPSHPADEA